MLGQHVGPAPPDAVRRFEVRTFGVGEQMIVLPSWGFLEAVELIFPELLPNYDAASPRRLRIGVEESWGSPLPFKVYAVCRDIAEPGRYAEGGPRALEQLQKEVARLREEVAGLERVLQSRTEHLA